MKQETLIEESAIQESKTPIKKLSCKYHLWATPEHFIEMVIKKTGEKVMRCIICARHKREEKLKNQAAWVKEKENISDYYVRRTLALGKGSLKMGDYPDELVQAKKAVIQLKRAVSDKLAPLKTCHTHGKLYQEDVIKSGKSRDGSQQWKCKKCMKEIHKKNYELNKLTISEKHKKYRTENKEQVKKIKRESWLKHREKYLKRENERRLRFKKLNPELYKQNDRKRVDELSDSYVKKIIVNRTSLKNADVPQPLVECMRVIIQLKRKIKKEKDQNKLTTLKEKVDGTN